MLTYIGFDDAIMGIVRQFNNSFVVYDYEKVIEILMCNMSREDAEEYFEFNTLNAYVGEHTPRFVKVYNTI